MFQNEIKKNWVWFHINVNTCIIAMMPVSKSIGFLIKINVNFIKVKTRLENVHSKYQTQNDKDESNNRGCL